MIRKLLILLCINLYTYSCSSLKQSTGDYGVGSEDAYSERNKYKKGETIETYKTRQGTELALPVYYRNHIYNENEREKLWLEKLDKKERWICGQKVDISKDDKEYFKVLYEARKKNKRLGYGNNEKNWELKKYENERRNIKRLERARKAYAKR